MNMRMAEHFSGGPTENESWCDFEVCEYLPDISKVFAKKEAWLYSISATILVGMAGVLPLLVISVEAGHSLREGVSTDNLNLYLSFAAGGLLGDVFLHLLPEAWAHVHDGDDPHTSHFYIGFWILAGLCGFLTLEKLFAEDKGENNSVKKEKLAKEKVNTYFVDSFNFQMGMCTTFAILVHEIPHEIGDFAILLKSGFRRWDAAVGQLVTASAGLCGAIFGLVAEHAGDSTAWVLPLTSGGFIYIAMVQIIPDLLQETRPRESLKQTLMMLAGITSMAVVSFIH
ncbi:PREDICTED: zinc transporter ZIP13-like [Acropora digitifera]|uniref:zinc transporter ZIP13-like n=1 Tax=Acropora digitifera TaxID=70779 RepID=UPI00077A24C6|nr:PREDICTED: zinc transporter ZIP13-like [Acropora digitifera]